MIEMISHAVNGCIKLALALLVLCSCQPVCYDIEPEIPYFPQARQLKFQPSPFVSLSKEELHEEWAKELLIGLSFGHDMDLYRAITCFKRALILLPSRRAERRSQLEYYIFESYYLGRKYCEAIETFEVGTLRDISTAFPAYKELRIMLYECYIQQGKVEKAQQILDLLGPDEPELRDRLELWSSFLNMDFENVGALAACQEDGDELTTFVGSYQAEALSVRKARLLNGVLPGLGYAYVGQKQAAATSFLINALFTGASYYFFKNGNAPMGVITLSLESGWYLGGINGAGLAAAEYNKRFYEENAKDMLCQHRLIPFLMLETSF